MEIFLWVFFTLGQILSAGNMNYQQEAGYYEINPIYGKHPSKRRVYLTKAVEIIGLYVLTAFLPDYRYLFLVGANIVCFGFIIYDKIKGIAFKFRW